VGVGAQRLFHGGSPGSVLWVVTAIVAPLATAWLCRVP
jgi:hypothetical protein